MKETSKKALSLAVTNINCIIETIPTNSITETNQLMYAAAMIVTNDLGIKISKNAKTKQNKQPAWKMRLEQQVLKMRNDISCLETMKKGILKNTASKTSLIKKYLLNGSKTIAEVSEELKQRVIATTKKVERFEARIKQYRQNRIFRINQRRFYQDLEEGLTKSNIMPDREETTKFWKNIWKNPKNHNSKAAWISAAEKQLHSPKMAELVITTQMIKKQVKKVKNWSAPGRDELHGYWL